MTGVLTVVDLMKALALRRQETAIGDVMQRHIENADPSEMAETALARLHGNTAAALCR